MKTFVQSGVKRVKEFKSGKKNEIKCYLFSYSMANETFDKNYFGPFERMPTAVAKNMFCIPKTETLQQA